jgi:hypothetical protein
MTRTEEMAVSGGKGSTANFVWRCGIYLTLLPNIRADTTKWVIDGRSMQARKLGQV